MQTSNFGVTAMGYMVEPGNMCAQYQARDEFGTDSCKAMRLNWKQKVTEYGSCGSKVCQVTNWETHKFNL